MDEERPGVQVRTFGRRADPVAGGPTRDLYRLIEQATDYILALDDEARLSYISPSIERDFGYAAASVLGRTLLEFVHPDDVEAVATAFANRTAGGQLRDFVIRARTIDGTYRLLEVSTKNLLDDPNVGAIVINARDVTDRQRAEARFRAVFESSAIGMALVAPDREIVETNAAFAGMLGYEVDELRGRSVADVTHPDDLGLDAELAAEVFRGDRSSYQVEKRYVRRDGSLVWGRLTASSLPQADEGTGLGLRLIEDITATKRAEEARVEAEERFRALVETIPAVTYIWESTINIRSSGGDDVAKITYTSPQIEALVGFTVEQWEGDQQLWLARVHPDDRDEVLERTADAERDGVPFEMEYRYLAKDGRVVWVRDSALLIERTPDGRPWRFQGVMMDVTDRKLVEESLADTSERLDAIVNGSPLAIVSMDLDGIVRSWNPAAERMLGWTAESAIGRFLPHVGVEGRSEFERMRDRVVATGEVSHTTVLRRRKDGTHLDVMLSSGPLHDRSGRVIGLIAVLADVTDTREAQRRLAEAERRYRTLVEHLPAVTYLHRVVDADRAVRYEALYVSPQVQTILGYEPQRWTSELLWESSLHPDDREHVLETLAEAVRAERAADVEYRLCAADGHVVWVREQSSPLLEGGTLYWQGVLYDITAAKEAELALREAEERYRVLVEQIPAVTFTDDDTPEHVNLYVSPQLRDLIGVEADAAMTDPDLFRRHIHPDDAPRVWEEWARAIAEARPFEAEYRVLHTDGRIRWVWERSAIMHPEGRPTLTQGVIFDITDRKQAEDVLRESETEVRRSFEILKRTDDERRQLLRHLVASETAERGRLADGIEDRSLQDFAAVGLRLETLRRNLEDPEQQGAVDRLGDTVQQALARLRHLLVELRPRELETEGLAAALEHYARAAAPGVRATVRNALASEPDPDVRALAYRLAQDALSLALDRAGTGEVVTQVDERDGGVVVRIHVEPRGESCASDETELVSVRERAEIAGGRVTVLEGGEVELWLPAHLADAS
jgi:PAS domain S-box-containing protein